MIAEGCDASWFHSRCFGCGRSVAVANMHGGLLGGASTGVARGDGGHLLAGAIRAGPLVVGDQSPGLRIGTAVTIPVSVPVRVPGGVVNIVLGLLFGQPLIERLALAGFGFGVSETLTSGVAIPGIDGVVQRITGHVLAGQGVGIVEHAVVIGPIPRGIRLVGHWVSFLDALHGGSGPTLERGAGRPENRVTARSKAPQNRWTGLALPRKRPRNVENTRSTSTRVSQNRCACSASYAACRKSPVKGIAPSISTGMGQIGVATPSSPRHRITSA